MPFDEPDRTAAPLSSPLASPGDPASPEPSPPVPEPAGPAPGVSRDAGPSAGPAPGVSRDPGPSAGPAPGVSRDPGPSAGPAPGVSRDPGPSAGPAPGVSGDRGLSSDPAPPLSAAQVVRDHEDLVRACLLRAGVPYQEVADVAQEVFLTIARRLPAFTVPERLSTKEALRIWVLGICAVHVGSRNRPDRRVLRFATLDDGIDSVPSPAPGAVEQLERLDAASLLARLLAQLPEERRAVFVAHEIDGETMEDFAAQHGIPVATAYNRLRLARRDLRAAAARLSAKDRRCIALLLPWLRDGWSRPPNGDVPGEPRLSRCSTGGERALAVPPRHPLRRTLETTVALFAVAATLAWLPAPQRIARAAEGPPLSASAAQAASDRPLPASAAQAASDRPLPASAAQAASDRPLSPSTVEAASNRPSAGQPEPLLADTDAARSLPTPAGGAVPPLPPSTPTVPVTARATPAASASAPITHASAPTSAPTSAPVPAAPAPALAPPRARERDERVYLGVARKALATGQPDVAEAVLHDRQRRFARGDFAHERAALADSRRKSP
jgi:RNA polymerase sigma-70 factor (ECF subfamily)